MARFQPKSFSYFLERMAQRVVARSRLTDLEEGGVIHTVLAAVARELDDVSFQMSNLQRIWDIDTAQAEDLDDRARDLNPDKLARLQAAKATGSAIFSRVGTVGAVTIPAGTIVRVPASGPEFATSASGSIANGSSSSAAVAIVAVEAGEEGNVDAAAIAQMDAVAGVEAVTNPAATTGGQDSETDGQFRERIKLYLRSLPRGTPDALKYAVLATELAGFGRIVTAEVVERLAPQLGIVDVFVDDGAGTIVVLDDNYGTPEAVVTGATGGEIRLFLLNKPVRVGASVVVRLNTVIQTEGTAFTLNYATGQITLTTALAPGDDVTAGYTWYEGLVAEAQKIIDGDPADRTNYPGYRAAGTQVFVVSPTVLQQSVTGVIALLPGFDGTTVRASVVSALTRYINSLPINGDVIVSELIAAAQSIAGVADVAFSVPSGNIVIGDGELARVQSANITLT